MAVPETSPDEAVAIDLMQALAAGREVALADVWQARIEQHFDDSYAGVRIAKFPEDLRVYERILWERAPRVVIEVGVLDGGSALWLRDRLFDFQRYRCGPAPTVIAVDVELGGVRARFADLPSEASAGIELVEGDIKNEQLLATIRAMVPDGAEVFVIEDAAHDAETTLACLRGLAPLIAADGYYMVEDTCVDVEALRVSEDWPRGAGTALEQWLADDPLGRRFRRRPDLQPYGLTCHPGGLVQRVADL